MTQIELQKLLGAMIGARLEEYCLRKASSRLTFSKMENGANVLFAVETNSDISTVSVKESSYEDCISKAAVFLYQNLEFEISDILIDDSGGYEFRLGNGFSFYIIDFDKLWDNVFSIRVKDWPAAGDRGDYFFT